MRWILTLAEVQSRLAGLRPCLFANDIDIVHRAEIKRNATDALFRVAKVGVYHASTQASLPVVVHETESEYNSSVGFVTDLTVPSNETDVQAVAQAVESIDAGT